MARPSFSLVEYLQMAERRDLVFLAERAPESVKTKVLWRCKHCGKEQMKSYHYLGTQVHGCRCQNGQALPLSAYLTLAKKLGITYIEQEAPRNIFEKVRWVGKDMETFEACYRDLGYERLPIYVRKHLE